MTWVSGSSAAASRTSDSVRSAWFPSVAKNEKPSRRARAQSRIAVASAPEWDRKAIPPASGMPGANVALSRREGRIHPRQFGPKDADGLLAEPRPELGLARLAGLAGLPKSRGEHDRAADAFRDTVLQGWQDSRRRDRDHRQVDGFADRQEGGGCRQPLDDVRPRVHGPDAALESRRRAGWRGRSRRPSPGPGRLPRRRPPAGRKTA